MKHVSFLTMAALLISTPSAMAAELGDSFKNTFEAGQWNYTSTVEMALERNSDMDVPFDIHFRADEEGGKSGDRYSEKGRMSARISNFESTDMWNDLTFVDLKGSYRADYDDATQTSHAMLDALQIDTDSKSFLEITGMLNEMAKLFTGKAFKISGQELSKALMEKLPTLRDEDLMALNAFHGQSVQMVTKAFADVLGDLIASGFLIDEVQNSGRKRIGSGLIETHTLTVAKSLSPQQADGLRSALMQFLREVAPLLADQMAAEIQNIPSDEFAAEFNEFLSLVSQTSMEVRVDVASALLEKVEFKLDFKNLGVPLLITGTMDFDYAEGYNSVIPRDEQNVIDINKVLNGLISMVGLSGANLIAEDFDPSWLDDAGDYDSSYYLALDTLDEIDSFLWNMCGDDRMCRRTEINRLRRDLQQFRREGKLGQEEYRWKLKDLQSLR